METQSSEAFSALPDPARVHAILRSGGCPWPAPVVVDSVGSTNADLVALAAQGAVDGTCEVAGEQTAGRGRHGRTWHSAPGAGLWSSTLITECTDPARLPILAALAAVDAARALSGPELAIKWPNDLLTSDGRKIAGILAERCDAGVVVGIGINLAQEQEHLPTEMATSWLLETGCVPDRSALLGELLLSLYRWVREDWGVVLAEYRAASVTLGRSVKVTVPGGQEWSGEAVDIDPDGHLVVRDQENLRTVVAGDVVHATIAP